MAPALEGGSTSSGDFRESRLPRCYNLTIDRKVSEGLCHKERYSMWKRFVALGSVWR